MFVVKEDLVGKHVVVQDSRGGQLMYRGSVRSIALNQSTYVLLVEITEAGASGSYPVGELVLCTIPNEWETVKLAEHAETEPA